MAKILLVGNDPAEREVRALIIEFGGHHCKMTASLEEAVHLLERESFELVVTDFKTNGSSQAEIAKGLKGAFPEVAVLVLTDSGETVVEEADAVLAIPCPPETLLQRIEQVLKPSAGPAAGRLDQKAVNALSPKYC